MLGEEDANEFGTPLGMIATEGLSLEEDGILDKASRGRLGTMVSGRGHGSVIAASLKEQMLDGAARKTEALSEGHAVELLVPVCLPDGSSDPLFYGARRLARGDFRGRFPRPSGPGTTATRPL